MSVTSKSPKDVLFVAWRIAQQSLKPYSHLYSPKKLMQHQLFGDVDAQASTRLSRPRPHLPQPTSRPPVDGSHPQWHDPLRIALLALPGQLECAKIFAETDKLIAQKM